MKKIIAILIAVAVLLSVSVIAIHAVSSDNIELPKTDTTTTEAAEATETEPEITEAVVTEPETTEAVETESKTTPPLETEPDVTEPIQLTTEQFLAGKWVGQDGPPEVYFAVDDSSERYPIVMRSGGPSTDHFSGEIIKSGDVYVSGNEFFYRYSGEERIPADATIYFPDDDTLVIHIQNEENDIDFTWTYVRWSVPIDPEIGREFVPGTFKYIPGRFEMTEKNHIAKITFNEDMTMYFEPYTDEDSVRINGAYEIMMAGDIPQFAQKIADGFIKEDDYVARVTVNEEELGTVQMPTVSYYQLETNRAFFRGINYLDDKIIIDSDELESNIYYRIG